MGTKRKSVSTCACMRSEKVYEGDILEITTLEFIDGKENVAKEQATIIVESKELKLQFANRVEPINYIKCPMNHGNRFYEVVGNIYGKPHLNYIEVLGTGYEFYRAAQNINNNWEIEYPKISAPLIIPISINLAFACELFLKALLIIEEKEYKVEHDLMGLYKILNGKTQVLIFEIVSANYEYETGKSITRNQFLDALDVVKKYFVNQRYIFEKPEFKRQYENGIGIAFIKKLCDALLLIVNSRIEEYFAFELLIDDKAKVQYLQNKVGQ